MSEDTPSISPWTNPKTGAFDKAAWLRSMLYESGNRFAAAVADQECLVRNETEAKAAFWRAVRFPDLVCKLTYDYEADEPIRIDPDEWWNGEHFHRAAAEEMAGEIQGARASTEHVIRNTPDALAAVGACRLVHSEDARLTGSRCPCGLSLLTPTESIRRNWCCVCDASTLAGLERAIRGDETAV